MNLKIRYKIQEITESDVFDPATGNQVTQKEALLLAVFDGQNHETEHKGISIGTSQSIKSIDPHVYNSWHLGDEYHSSIYLEGTNPVTPSKLQCDEECLLYLNRGGDPVPGKVIGVHSYGKKIKYDLELTIDFGDGDSEKTRIYNIESAYVTQV